MTYIKHQPDRLTQKMEENAAENNELKNLIRKMLRQGFTKETKQEYFMKKLPTLKKKTMYLKVEVESE